MPDQIVSLFDFEGDEIRVQPSDDGEPLFIVSDLCRILKIKTPRDAVRRLDDDEKGEVLTRTPGGEQYVVAVNEPGLYSLVLSARSSDPRVKRFKRYVTHVILPAVRREGGYISPSATPEQLKTLQARIAQLESALENSYRVNYWLAAKQGAGEFITRSLPPGDED